MTHASRTDADAAPPMLYGSFGMCASTHFLATASGMAVLERGGNAFDAACAMGLVLQVVEPDLNGPGGDLVGLAQAAAWERPRVLMGQGPAPAAASILHLRDELGLAEVPGSGPLAAAVPGAMDAWLVLLRDLGTWELADVAEFALGYARDGHPLSASAARAITGVEELFTRHWPTSARLWLPGGHTPPPGAWMRNPAWAATLEGLVAAGRGALSRERRIEAARQRWRTSVADAVAEFARRPALDSSGTAHAGVISGDDIVAFEAGWEDAVCGSFLGHTVYKADAWSQGPVLLETLALLEGYAGGDATALDPDFETGAHTLLEALKLAMADRDAYFGDVERRPGLVAALTEPGYVAARQRLIEAEASAELRPGTPPGWRPYLPQLPPQAPIGQAATTRRAGSDGAGSIDSATGEPTLGPRGAVRGDTCHLDVVDRWGNLASITPSGGWLQSSPTIPATGFCLGTRLQMTWLDERSPSALMPGRRPRTTLSPTIVALSDGGVLACGTPGGDQQDQWQASFLLRVLAGGLELRAAIDAPALHTTSAISSFWPRTWHPAGAVVEARFDPETIAGLRARGHELTVVDGWSLGRLSAVRRAPHGGVGPDAGRMVLAAAANTRGGKGSAAGR